MTPVTSEEDPALAQVVRTLSALTTDLAEAQTGYALVLRELQTQLIWLHAAVAIVAIVAFSHAVRWSAMDDLERRLLTVEYHVLGHDNQKHEPRQGSAHAP